mmetsp:Transcript_3445/g.7592  ORF Transcript_3445/g.7592 Transcript_3445/m.7592 type:complete len:128 (-) Transcript_3445:34-417(-)
MRQLSTRKGFGQMYEEDFLEPLRRIIDAYQRASILIHERSGRTSYKYFPREARFHLQLDVLDVQTIQVRVIGLEGIWSKTGRRKEDMLGRCLYGLRTRQSDLIYNVILENSLQRAENWKLTDLSVCE